MVRIIQRWDGQRPTIKFLLCDFRRWLINEKMEQRRRLSNKMARAQTVNLTKIWWIEKQLQTPIDDYRKFVVWCILAHYLINIRKCSAEEATSMIRDWLDKCSSLKRLDFSPNYMIKYNVNSAKSGYLPISLEILPFIPHMKSIVYKSHVTKWIVSY